MIATRSRIGFWGGTFAGFLVTFGIWGAWLHFHPLQLQYGWPYVWTGIQSHAAEIKAKSMRDRILVPKPVEPSQYFVYTKGPWLATQSMIDQGMAGVKYEEITVTPQKMHEVLRQQIYNGGAWQAFRWPLCVSVLILFGLQFTGCYFDAKRLKLLKTDGIQLRGRKMMSLRRFNGWGRKDDFVLKVSEYDRTKA